MGIDDRLERLAMNAAFITLKDHKDNFVNNPQCRNQVSEGLLINPPKPEFGKVSKLLMDDINSRVRNTLVHQWNSTNDAIECFKSIPDKNICTFIQYDIDEFYPSISKQLLQDSLRHAKQFTEIPDKSIEIIYHSRKTLLFSGNNMRIKKSGDSNFDVTMGSFDEAELCELVHKLFNRNNLKVSYSCLPSIKKIITSRNKNILSNTPDYTNQLCNCRQSTSCDGKCLKTILFIFAT